MPMRVVAKRLGLGKRAQVLAVVGGTWMFLGVGLLLQQHAPSVPGQPLTYIEPWIRGLAWIICGAYAWWVGLSAKSRDAWGWTMLTVMPMIHLLSGFYSVLMWAIPGKPVGHLLSWVGFAVWGGVVQLLMILADWPNPLKVPDDL